MRAVTRLLLLAALPVLAGRARWGAGGEVVVSGAAGAGAGAGAARPRPEFADADTAVAAARGQDVELHCPVLRLGDTAVSWVRSRDLQILSHGGDVFTADGRVSLRVSAAGDGGDGGDDGDGGDGAGGGGRRGDRNKGTAVTRHSLRIRKLRLADGGRYECQLNTEPKMSLFFNLTVTEEPASRVVVEAAEAVVAGAAGGAASLQCTARYEPRPPPGAPPLDLRWAKDGRPLLAQEAGSRGVWVQTERSGPRGRSQLTLGALRPADAGQYRCSARGVSAVVVLLVGPESPMEAMQRDQSADGALRISPGWPLALVLLLRLWPV